jgi:uncharacterized membrane protein
MIDFVASEYFLHSSTSYVPHDNLVSNQKIEISTAPNQNEANHNNYDPNPAYWRDLFPKK